MTLQKGDRLGPHEIVALIGAGGMGEVYKARDTRLGREVAIKVLPAGYTADADRLRRFEQEARAAGQLNHPNILTVFDVGTHEGAPYIVTELLEGETLQERLRPGSLPVRKAVEIAMQIAHGLAAAHEQAIIHRDLKPANVFVTKLSVPSSLQESAATAASAEATAIGTALGTMGYVSPEQLRGRPVDHRADIFSFGCVLYEMLSGRRAFAGETAADTMAALLDKDPAPLGGAGSNIHAALEGIVHRCLEKLPENRFSSSHDLALALNDVMEAHSTVRTPSEPPAKSIVVLPFENLSPDPENAFFADGLTEELIADLSKVHTLRVISRTSAMLLKGSKKDVPTIARELNVRYVLEGSVRRAGNALRITAQLIDAASDAHLWAEKYGGTMDDVFAIQEKVSRAIVDALRLTLTTDEKHRLAARWIPDIKAFDLYLRARHEMYRLSESALDHAVQLAREAIDIAGPNSLLFSLLAEIHYWYHDQGIRPDEETLRRVESWASKAVELDPESAGGLRARGLIAFRRGDMRQAIHNFQRAEELQVSGDTLWILGWACAEVGRMPEARRHAADAALTDPLFWACPWSKAFVALLDGDFENALTRMRDAAEVGGGETIHTFFLGICSAYAGRLDEACDQFGRVVKTVAGGISAVSAALRALYRRDIDAARKLLGDQALRDLAKLDKEFSWWLAAGCSHSGQTEEALHWLANAIDLGFVNHRFFSTIDPFLARLRGDPRFETLMERAREKQREFEV
jgi:serine/threonine protein kinase/tetratricopeptide (TPR) repeat protein